MKNLVIFLALVVIFSGCGGTSKVVKQNTSSMKYYIGISQDFDNDTTFVNITGLVVKELISYSQVKFVDRRNLKNKVAVQAANLAAGESETVKLEDPMMYIVTGSIMTLGSKKIVRISVLNVQTSMTEASLTFDYENVNALQVKIQSAVAELMKSFPEQVRK